MTKKDALVGQWFHVLGEDGYIDCQGLVVSNPEPGCYFVQYFDWLRGDPCHRSLVRLDKMTAWRFYESNEAMRFAYQHGSRRRPIPGREDKPTRLVPDEELSLDA